MSTSRESNPVCWWAERAMMVIVLLYFTCYPRNAASDFVFCTALCALLYIRNNHFNIKQPSNKNWAVVDSLFLGLGILLFGLGGYYGQQQGHLNWVAYIAIVIIYFYYGFIQHYLAQCYLAVGMLSLSKGNTLIAAMLTGAVFGLLHLLEPGLIIPSIIGGTLFAFYYLSRGKLWIVVVVHALISTALIYWLSWE